jgi:hypothetical protein
MRFGARARPIAALFGIVAAALAAAGDDAPRPKKQRVEVAGKLVCVGCYLEREYGADAQCTLYAKHAQGFLAEGGTLYTLLDNGRGHALIAEKKLAGVPLVLEAWAFPKAQVLEAIRFRKKEGEAFVQYDWCRNCGFEKGEHAGGDLCEDCAK